MSEPTCPCPYCGDTCSANWVSVGFTSYDVQCGPYYCEGCRASQIGPNDNPRQLTDEELKFKWYKPGSPIGSSVNALGGIPVGEKEAMLLYQLGILDNQEFDDERES